MTRITIHVTTRQVERLRVLRIFFVKEKKAFEEIELAEGAPGRDKALLRGRIQAQRGLRKVRKSGTWRSSGGDKYRFTIISPNRLMGIHRMSTAKNHVNHFKPTTVERRAARRILAVRILRQ